jgi:DNA invertase Pin-like site-specific DNA recombinase
MARASKTTTETTKAVGYIRVSTDSQAEHGVSLEAQKAKIEAYAALYELTLVDIVVDAGVSAKTLDRPGLTRALAMLRKGEASALLVAKLDRLTRSVKDLGTLVEDYFASDKITLLSVADAIDTRTAAGRLVLNVLGSVAQWERETIGERTSEAMAHKREQGQRTSLHAPYGFQIDDDGKTLVADASRPWWLPSGTRASAGCRSGP